MLLRVVQFTKLDRSDEPAVCDECGNRAVVRLANPMRSFSLFFCDQHINDLHADIYDEYVGV